MIALAAITMRNLPLFRETRLRALVESPSAFGSTYAREIQFSDGDWTKRVERWNGNLGIGFLAIEDGQACGIAGALLEEPEEHAAQLVSMWTAPAYRRRGVGSMLVDGVADWALQRGVRIINLMVTSSNAPAIRFYERLGFTCTGKTVPYPNDPALIEHEMSRLLR